MALDSLHDELCNNGIKCTIEGLAMLVTLNGGDTTYSRVVGTSLNVDMKLYGANCLGLRLPGSTEVGFLPCLPSFLLPPPPPSHTLMRLLTDII
jgi:hypothetical protein